MSISNTGNIYFLIPCGLFDMFSNSIMSCTARERSCSPCYKEERALHPRKNTRARLTRLYEADRPHTGAHATSTAVYRPVTYTFASADMCASTCVYSALDRRDVGAAEP